MTDRSIDRGPAAGMKSAAGPRVIAGPHVLSAGPDYRFGAFWTPGDCMPPRPASTEARAFSRSSAVAGFAGGSLVPVGSLPPQPEIRPAASTRAGETIVSRESRIIVAIPQAMWIFSGNRGRARPPEVKYDRQTP